jgi:predicted ATPase with chaperone activity
LVDRFEMLEFTDQIGEITYPGKKILERVQAAQAFSEDLFGNWKANSRRPFVEVLSTIRPTMMKLAGVEQQTSQRRKVAILRVARTLADLDASRSVEKEHIDLAVTHCRDHFERLKRWE